MFLERLRRRNSVADGGSSSEEGVIIDGVVDGVVERLEGRAIQIDVIEEGLDCVEGINREDSSPPVNIEISVTRLGVCDR